MLRIIIKVGKSDGYPFNKTISQTYTRILTISNNKCNSIKINNWNLICKKIKFSIKMRMLLKRMMIKSLNLVVFRKRNNPQYKN